MGAELSRQADALGASSSSVRGLRRVGSSGALDAQRKKASPDAGMPTSASTTSLTALAAQRGYTSFSDMNGGSGGGASTSDPSTPVTSTPREARSSINSTSSSGSRGPKLLDNPLFNSMRRSRGSRGGNSTDSNGNANVAGLSAEDHVVESLDLPMVEWEGYVTKRGHLVRNWKMRFFTLEGNLVSCTPVRVDPAGLACQRA